MPCRPLSSAFPIFLLAGSAQTRTYDVYVLICTTNKIKNIENKKNGGRGCSYKVMAPKISLTHTVERNHFCVRWANDEIMFKSFCLNWCLILCESGLDYSASQGHLWTRRSQCPDAAEDDARMGEILQEPLWRLFHAAVGRCHPLLRRLFDRSQHRRGRPRWQRKSSFLIHFAIEPFFFQSLKFEWI